METVNAHSAMVDTDFVNHVAAMNKAPSEVVRIFNDVMSGLGVNALMHPLVRKNEILSPNANLSELFSQKAIEVISLEDIFSKDEEKKGYYEYLVKELYSALHGVTLAPTTDVFTYWKSGDSLGEIHSTSLCLLCGYGLFLSDDSDAKHLKSLIQMRALGNIQVYNRKDVIEAYLKNERPQNDTLSRHERRAFVRAGSPSIRQNKRE